MTTALEIRDLRFSYADGSEALKGVDLLVDPVCEPIERQVYLFGSYEAGTLRIIR